MAIRFDDSATLGKFVASKEYTDIEFQVATALELVETRQGSGNEYMGWLNLPQQPSGEEAMLQEAIKQIQSDSDVLVVIGIGGSYLGARAVIELLMPPFNVSGSKRVEVLFAGNHMSARTLENMLAYLQDKEVSLNVISKSGTTTEPAIAFRILRQFMEAKYGKDAAKRIYATTDANRGALRQLATEQGYRTFVVPDDVGGRYSVLTAVGLLPIGVAGIDITELMGGAKVASYAYSTPDCADNDCLRYATMRNLLLRRGYQVELLINFEPCLHYFTEWWKQLFGESEGKDGKGLFVAGADFTTDLHSMGQYIQDGRRVIFETAIEVKDGGSGLKVPHDNADLDGLNYLAGTPISKVNLVAQAATRLAHVDGQVPNLRLIIDQIDENHVGQMIYFFEKACAISGYLNGINPFDQEGVEAYKRNMFAMLGKPGYEDLRQELISK